MSCASNMVAPEQWKYRLRVPDEIADLIRRLHPQLKRKIRSALRLILIDPHTGKALKDDLKGLHGFRVGRIRIIYRVAPPDVIEIIAIGPRKTIYQATCGILQREANGKRPPGSQ